MGNPSLIGSELHFDRPAHLVATEPPERHGLDRDQVRLLVSTPDRDYHTTFAALPDYLDSGDLLVVNESATIPASLKARSRFGEIVLNLSTSYGGGLWVAEPRWSVSKPGPLPLRSGETLCVGDHRVRMVSPFPGIPRLWFVQIKSYSEELLTALASPLRYGYIKDEYPLDPYQSLFNKIPGSAEMPSAARPFTDRVLRRLTDKGVQIVGIVLHTGVSSLELEHERIEDHKLYPEPPYWVPEGTASSINTARQNGSRVIAVGTTVVRAIESARDGTMVRSSQGFTRLFVHPGRGLNVISGLLTGFHDPSTSHLAMLCALAGSDHVKRAYQEAIEFGYLWHEFGDSHLLLPAR